MISKYNLLGHEFEFEIHDDNELTSNIIRQYGCNIDMESVYAFQYLLRKGEIFLDIGANIGWQTVFGSLTVRDSGKVYAFEPDEKNYAVLERNIKLNNLNNVVAVQQALADSEYTGNLYSSFLNFGNHMLDPAFVDPRVHASHCQVRVTTLDQFLETNNVDIKRIGLVKIDVEGSEHRVLEGGKKFFSQQQPNIILEYSPSQMRQCGRSVFDIFSFIDRLGYMPYQIEKIDITKPNYRIIPLTFVDLLQLTQMIMNTTEYRDLLLLPKN